MKKMIFAISILASILVQARTTDDFHSLIVESADARRALSQKLKKAVNAVDSANQDQLQRQEKTVITESQAQIESIAVPTRTVRNSLKADSKATTSQDSQEKMERLSQEMDDAKE